jgi:hypothetical protein
MTTTVATIPEPLRAHADGLGEPGLGEADGPEHLAEPVRKGPLQIDFQFLRC